MRSEKSLGITDLCSEFPLERGTPEKISVIPRLGMNVLKTGEIHLNVLSLGCVFVPPRSLDGTLNAPSSFSFPGQ